MDLKKLEEEPPRLTARNLDDVLPEGAPVEKNTFVSWCMCVAGWLVCAFMCLWLMIELEAWPYAYDMIFWAVILILFCNILVFLFISSRFGQSSKKLFFAVFRVCLGEGLILLMFYILGRFAIGA